MSRLYKNIIYNLIGQGIILALGLVAVKYIFGRLGEDALGIIYFIATFNIVLCTILELGFCSTTIREVSIHSESEPEYIRDLVRTFSLLYWGAWVLSGVALFFLSPIIVEKWINLKTIDHTTAIYVLRVVGITSFVSLPRTFYISLLRGLQRMKLINIIEVVTGGVYQFGIILILSLGGRLLHVVHWLAVSYIINILPYLIVSSHFFSFQAIVPGYSAGVIGRNLSFASRMTFASIIAMLHTQTDKLIISKLLPISVVGYYTFAYGNVSKSSRLTGAISQAAFPELSALFNAGARAELMSQYRKLQDLLCFGIVPIFAAISFALLPLFSYLLNKEAALMLLLPVTLLCIGFYMSGTLEISYVFSLAVGRPGITARLNFYSLFLVLPVTVLLVYYLGLVGAGLAWVFYQVFAYFYYVPRICRECLEITPWSWYLHVLRIFVLAALTYGMAWLVSGIIGNRSIFSLIFGYIGASIAFLIGSYFMIGTELKETLIRFMQAFKTRILEST